MDAKIFQTAIDELSHAYDISPVKIDPHCFDKQPGAAYVNTDRAVTTWLMRFQQAYYFPFRRISENDFWTVEDKTDPRHVFTLGVWTLHKPHFLAPILAADMVSPDRVRQSRAASTLTADYCFEGKFRAFYRPAEAMQDHIRSHRYELNDRWKWYTGEWAVLKWEVEAYIRTRDLADA